MIFSKNCFKCKTIIKKRGRFVDFDFFFGNIYGYIRPVLKNLIAGHSESVKILPKC